MPPDHWEVEVEVHVLHSAFVATRRWAKALSLPGRVGVPVREAPLPLSAESSDPPSQWGRGEAPRYCLGGRGNPGSPRGFCGFR